MKNFLNSVKVARPRYNAFDLGHEVKMSGNMGYLIPSCIIDAVPGDKFQLGCEALVRLAPMVAPMMHRVNFFAHWYFVPKRILWKNWDKFITNTEVAGSVPAHPYVQLYQSEYVNHPLYDYLGLPDPGATNIVNVSAMPFAAYQMIYNEYYRDQNLVTTGLWDSENGLTDGAQPAPSYATLTALRKRAWEHDYFTAALPFAQKGDAVEIPISGDVVLKSDVQSGRFVKSDGSVLGPDVVDYDLKMFQPSGVTYADGTSDSTVKYDPQGTLEVQNADTTINDLRRAYALQRFLEKLARGGSRLTEFIRTMFGVTSSDARLQRPEYITGVKSPVVISEVLNTTGTVDAPQGNMAGHGVSVANGYDGHFFCEEHGYIMCIVSVMPKTAYQQGIPKHWLKINDTFEHFNPDFANIGEQEILNKEVYAPHAAPDGTFGYIPRYGEYKFEQDRVAGDFKLDLDFWHMGRIFTSDPNLNAEFVECNPTHRVFAVTDPSEDKLWMQIYHKVYANRLMPKYGTPTF